MGLSGRAESNYVLRGKITSIENAADIIKRVIVVGDTEPTTYPALWFNTDPYGKSVSVAMLSLRDDERGSEIQAAVGDEVYGVRNATANDGATAKSYDFTVL